MIGKQTVKDMDKISRDGRLVADQANTTPLNQAAVVGEKDIQAHGAVGHGSNLPVTQAEGLLPRILRSLVVIALMSIAPAIGVILLTWQAGPKYPLTLFLTLLPPSFSMLMLCPIAANLAWERGRAPLFIALPLTFGLLLINWRLFLGSMGWDILAFEAAQRGDLSWTSWPILAGCLTGQAFILWWAESRLPLFKSGSA